MTHNKRKMVVLHETAPGPLERMRFSPDNDGEKSLLTLIEEHRPRQSEIPPTTPSEVSCNSSTYPPDDLNEEEGYRLDHSLMRLGGNGF